MSVKLFKFNEKQAAGATHLTYTLWRVDRTFRGEFHRVSRSGERDAIRPPILGRKYHVPPTTMAIYGATVSAFAQPRQHIRTASFGAENRSMCITLLVSTARCARETDSLNGPTYYSKMQHPMMKGARHQYKGIKHTIIVCVWVEYKYAHPLLRVQTQATYCM
eukprot:scaffold391842_cov139-Cyclotella_meneghiniana.AAC.1